MMEKDLIEACTGGETDPRMWPLDYLHVLLGSLERGEWEASVEEDWSACQDILRECRKLADGLRKALSPLEREQTARCVAEAAGSPVADADMPF